MNSLLLYYSKDVATTYTNNDGLLCLLIRESFHFRFPYFLGSTTFQSQVDLASLKCRVRFRLRHPLGRFLIICSFYVEYAIFMLCMASNR